MKQTTKDRVSSGRIKMFSIMAGCTTQIAEDGTRERARYG